MRFSWIVLALAVASGTACHPGPVIDAGAKQPSVGGTIAGIVKTADNTTAVPGRKITVTDTNSGRHYETTTAANGGYTLKVPEGKYHIDVELRPGESLAKRPDDTTITNSDLDASRDFVITVK